MPLRPSDKRSALDDNSTPSPLPIKKPLDKDELLIKSSDVIVLFVSSLNKSMVNIIVKGYCGGREVHHFDC